MHGAHDRGVGGGARTRHRQPHLVADAGRTIRQHQDAVGELGRLLDVVGHEDDRPRLLAQQPRQLLAHAEARQVVEGREGLVHEQEVGVSGQGADELHPLPHPARELVRVVPFEGREPHQVEQRSCPAAPLRVIRDVPEAQADVLPDRAPGKEAVLLEDHPHSLGPLDSALLGLKPAGGEVQESRLAATRGADDGHELAVTHLEIEVPQHLDPAVGDARAGHAQEHFARGRLLHLS